MIRACIGVFLLAAALPAQSKTTASTITFADGTTVEFATHSTGRTMVDSSSEVEDVPAGYDFHRLVFHKEGVLFGYDLEARKDGKGAFALRAKPINRQQIAIGSHGKWVDIPTLSGVREFPPLRVGDAVEVDILYNAATKERVYDVVKVLHEQAARTHQQLAGDRFSFKNVTIAAGGKGIGNNQDAWMRCGGLSMYLPERGTFYLSPDPRPDSGFQAAGWVDHKVLRLHAGSELVEIVSETNMLQKSEFATIWVWYVPQKTGVAARGLTFRCADSVDQVLPRK